MKKYLENKQLWILIYTAVYLLGFKYLESTVTRPGQYHVIHVRLDDYIPFVEYFIIPYVLWFFYIGAVVVFMFLTDREEYYRLCTFFLIGMNLSLLICALYPNGTDFRPQLQVDKNIWTRMVEVLYRADTCTNVFPSIHVYNSVACFLGLVHSSRLRGMKSRRLWLSGAFILSLAICLSTMFLKQHSVIDVSAALLLAILVHWLVYNGEEQRLLAWLRHPQRRAERRKLFFK